MSAHWRFAPPQDLWPARRRRAPSLRAEASVCASDSSASSLVGSRGSLLLVRAYALLRTLRKAALLAPHVAPEPQGMRAVGGCRALPYHRVMRGGRVDVAELALQLAVEVERAPAGIVEQLLDGPD